MVSVDLIAELKSIPRPICLCVGTGGEVWRMTPLPEFLGSGWARGARFAASVGTLTTVLTGHHCQCPRVPLLRQHPLSQSASHGCNSYSCYYRNPWFRLKPLESTFNHSQCGLHFPQS